MLHYLILNVLFFYMILVAATLLLLEQFLFHYLMLRYFNIVVLNAALF